MNTGGNIFGSDRGSEFDDSWFVDKDYSLGGGVVMKRTDIDHGFHDNAGKGPENWKRSDEKIYEEICEEMTSHSDLDATDINVRVCEGKVLLSGWVNTKQEKLLAEWISEEVTGVIEVSNELHLRNRLI